MSSILSNSGIDCKIFSDGSGVGFFENKIRVGDHDIDADDFCNLVMYFLTNTDLDVDDCRVKLVKDIESLTAVKGFNSGVREWESTIFISPVKVSNRNLQKSDLR